MAERWLMTIAVAAIILGTSARTIPLAASEPGPPLGCVIRSDPTCVLGQPPKITVALINQTTSDVYLVGSLDGSDGKFRYPFCYFEVTGPDGRPAPSLMARLCANMNTLREKDFVKVPPRGRFDPFQDIDDYGFFGPDELSASRFHVAGKYRVRFVYSSSCANIRDWSGDDPNAVMSNAKIASMFEHVPKVDVKSNEIEINVIASSNAALKEKVLKSYPEALRALEARFARAFGSVTGTEEHFVGKPNHLKINGRFTFASRRPNLAKVTRLATMTRMSDQKTSPPKETVFCCNTEHSFWLVREAGKREFTVRSFATDKEGQSFIRNQMPSWLYSYLDAPFSLGGPSMSAVIGEAGAAIERVSAVHQGDKAHLKIEFDCKKAKSKLLRSVAGWVVVSPDEKWVIREFEFTDARGVFHGRVEYTAPEDGFPIPKRVFSTGMARGERQPNVIQTYEFHELHFGDVPDSEFQLSTFGISEPLRSP